jgi:hypothetical protein
MNPDNTPEPGALCSLGVDFTMEDGGTPQTTPAIISGTVDEVAQAEASATAAAGGTPPEATEAPVETVGTPAASPAATPMASPAAGPSASPVASSREGTPIATPE